MHLPSKCLDKLKCSICNRLLSLLPIYTTKNDDNQQLSVCGRCRVPDNNNSYSRNEIYETLAEMVLFPCNNSKYGCMEDLLPKDMEQHELTCRYRLQSCIFDRNNQCKWEGCFNSLLNHCKTEHANLILEDYKFEINPIENCNIFNILQYGDELFFIEYTFNQITKQLKCILTHLCVGEIQKEYYVQINLKTDDATMSKILPTIEPDKNKPKSIDINIENMLNDNNTIVMGTVKINTNKEQFDLIVDVEMKGKVFSKLKCCECKGILYPPVFRCVNDQYACCNCKGKICSACSMKPCSCCSGYQTCSDCRLRTKHTLNINVESPINDIMNFVYYHCPDDCKFVGNTTDLKQHRTNCLNAPYHCLLKDEMNCNWENRRKDLPQHIFENHKENLIKINEVQSLQIDRELNYNWKQCKFVKFSGDSFKLIIQYRYDPYYPYLLWRLETIDTSQQCNYIKYEMNIFNNNNGKHFIIGESCAYLTFLNEYSNKDGPCIWLYLNQINDFLHNKTLSFKINIFK